MIEQLPSKMHRDAVVLERYRQLDGLEYLLYSPS